MIILIVDAAPEPVPAELIRAVVQGINRNILDKNNLLVVFNNIDSCLEDPISLRLDLGAIDANTTIDASAQSYLLECLDNKQPSRELQNLRELFLGV